MKTAGIIAEYNPFHNGHTRHICATKDGGAQAVVCVMSGCFVQRGEPAIMLPRARAEMALKNGADLILLLPLPWACSGAQSFASGAVDILNALGCIDMLSFGSECGSVETLILAAHAVDDYAVQENLRLNMLSGMAFATARQSAVSSMLGEAAQVLSNPNDTLAVEYIRALTLSGSGIEPYAVKREGAGHDSMQLNAADASASLIRHMLKSGEDVCDYMPSSAAEIMRRELEAGRAPVEIQSIERAILAKLRGMSADDFAGLPDMSEGLENRIYSAVRSAVTLEELYTLAKTKRYAHSRIRRAVINAFLGVTRDDCEGSPPYIRVLGFTQKGQELLKKMKESASLPIIMRAADVQRLNDRAKYIFELEAKAADLFALAMPKPLVCGTEYTDTVVMTHGRMQWY